MNGREGPLRILLVEDEPLLGRLVTRAMEARGDMEPAWAENGSEGLELALSWQPDVILLDLVLPGMSGLELLRRYRGKQGRAPVIAVTGAWEERTKETALSLGADYVMIKPVRWEEVFSVAFLLVEDLEGKCRALLRRLGAPENCRGFEQTVKCAALLGKRKRALLKEIYVEAGRQEKTTPGSVAKNIERLSGKLNKLGTPLYRRLSGKGDGEKPLNNREFLMFLVQAARIPL